MRRHLLDVTTAPSRSTTQVDSTSGKVGRTRSLTSVLFSFTGSLCKPLSPCPDHVKFKSTPHCLVQVNTQVSVRLGPSCAHLGATACRWTGKQVSQSRELYSVHKFGFTLMLFLRPPSRVYSQMLLITLSGVEISEHWYSPACKAVTLLMTSDGRASETRERPFWLAMSAVNLGSISVHFTFLPSATEEFPRHESVTGSPTTANTSSTPSAREALFCPLICPLTFL